MQDICNLLLNRRNLDNPKSIPHQHIHVKQKPPPGKNETLFLEMDNRLAQAVSRDANNAINLVDPWDSGHSEFIN